VKIADHGLPIRTLSRHARFPQPATSDQPGMVGIKSPEEMTSAQLMERPKRDNYVRPRDHLRDLRDTTPLHRDRTTLPFVPAFPDVSRRPDLRPVPQFPFLFPDRTGLEVPPSLLVSLWCCCCFPRSLHVPDVPVDFVPLLVPLVPLCVPPSHRSLGTRINSCL
jgi:hypothetical protein